MIPSGHKVFLVQNPKDVELLLMHNRTYAAEYALPPRTRCDSVTRTICTRTLLITHAICRIGHAVSSTKRVDIIAKAKALGVKVTNAKGRLTTES